MPPARSLLPIRSDSPGEAVGEADETHFVISNSNRWSRATLSFEGLEPDAWCEFSFHLEWHPQEKNRSAHDFAVVGVDFLTEDGSSIDFAYVPGLARTQIDPHSWHVSGPDYFDHGGSGGKVSLGFFVPSPTRKLAVTVRSWRNSHPFVIRDIRLLQDALPPSEDETGRRKTDWARIAGALRPLNARRTWLALTGEPTWIRFGVLSGRKLLIRGQIINESLSSEGALARIVYCNAKGEELPPPYPETAEAPLVGSFVNIPVHRQARRFTLDLIPPPEAVTADVGLQTWNDQTRMDLVTPLEISLEDDLTLEVISGDEAPDAAAFLKHFLDRVDTARSLARVQSDADLLNRLIDSKALTSLLTFQEELRAVQHGRGVGFSESGLVFRNFPAWPLPAQPQWTEDPFQSPAWRLDFQSLTWISNLSGEGKTDDLSRAIDLAVSWSRANPWGSPKDPISAHPQALSARAEAFLRLLSLSIRSQQSLATRDVLTLLAETTRHAFALAQIVGQNLFSHSIVHLHAACALLALASCLPRIPLAPYWRSIALVHLDNGFERFLDENGISLEQSFDAQLEVVSLGLILARRLKGLPEGQELHSKLTDRIRKNLKTVVAVTAPSGSLPPFGDAPQGLHHASWLRRLLSSYGTSLLSDPELAAELSYPPGRKVFSSQPSGLIAARRYDRNAHWNYFCVSLHGQHHEHDHFDCTSFVYSTGGLPWIIDPGGSSLHDTGAARQYLVSSRAHNIALPNGRGQMSGIGWIEAHDKLEGASIFVVGSNVYGSAYVHRRVFTILDNLDAVAVLDHFACEQDSITFEGLLHFDQDIIVAIANTQMGVAYRNKEKLKVIPYTINGHFSGISIASGRNDRPSMVQGFVASPTGGLQSANVLGYRFSGQEVVCGGVLLAGSDKAARTLSTLLDTANVKDVLSRSLPI